MAKNIYLRTASKLFFDDHYRDIPSMVIERINIDYDSIDFVFTYDCELEEKEAFIKEYFCQLKKEINRRLKNETSGR